VNGKTHILICSPDWWQGFNFGKQRARNLGARKANRGGRKVDLGKKKIKATKKKGPKRKKPARGQRVVVGGKWENRGGRNLEGKRGGG